MPTDEILIKNLETDLETLANEIQTVSIALAETLEALAAADEQIETRTAQMLGNILNLRAPEGNKLVYTNDDRRKVKLIETQQIDQDFQAYLSARKTLIETSATQKAEIEKNRNLHKSKLLILQYYANL